MEALKVVCNHKDIKDIREFKNLKQKQKKFKKYLMNLNDVIDDIFWVSKTPENKQEFDDLYNDDELWEKVINIREKYPTMFRNISHVEGENSDEDFENYENMICNQSRLEGIVGCIRSLMAVYDDIFQICECDCDCEYISCQCENCMDCRCHYCNLCVYTGCECDSEYVCDRELSDITKLKLNLEN